MGEFGRLVDLNICAEYIAWSVQCTSCVENVSRAEEIPPDYDDKGELSPIPAMKGKSYDMSCSSDSLRSMRETRRDITRYYFSRIGIKLSESYHNNGV